MRLFVAIALPEGVRGALADLSSRLRPAAAACGAKLARVEGIHLTLRFLGEVEEGRLDEITAALREACAGTGGIALTAGGIGFFPGPQRPRVLWVGVGGDTERLARLAGRCEEAARRLGFPAEDRPFRGHLTLLRIDERKAHGGREARDRLVSASRSLPSSDLGTWEAREAHVYRSELGPGGAVYTVVGHLAFD